jgi:hypothetical protein
MLDTLEKRIKKELFVYYMDKNGLISKDKAVGYIDYNEDRDECDIIIDGLPYTWEDLEKNISAREGWNIKIEFTSSGDDFD